MLRRDFIAGTAAGAASLIATSAKQSSAANERKYPPLVLFSKHLGWTDYDELAGRLSELGFDGADLTVRPGGHVLPENVEDDLPKAVEAIEKVGLKVEMITSGITDPGDAVTEKVLKTASGLGIRYYRIGSWRYEKDGDLIQQLKEWNAKLKVLALMNKTYNICAAYHNHSGDRYIGGSIWDEYLMEEGIDPKWVGANFDAGHAVAEGGNGAWATMFRLIAPRIKSSAIKDSIWIKTDRGWRHEFPPVGTGMVDWPRVLGMYKEINFTGPFSMHFEYPIKGSTEAETRKLHLEYIGRDIKVFKKMLQNAGLRA